MKSVFAIIIALVALIVGAGIGAAATGGAGQTTLRQTGTTTTKTVSVSGAAATVSTVTVTSLSAGAVLLNYSGSGIASSPPFTATTSTVIITVEVSSGNPADSIVGFEITPTNSSTPVSVQSVQGKVGTFQLYGYNLAPGENYYLAVTAANANWQIVVNATK